MNNKVSVIMNCLDASEFILEALDSAINQTHKNLEVIVWDNGSKEDIQYLIEQNYKDPRIKYYRNKKTEKLGLARNKAIEKSTGDYIAFLDCDDLWNLNKVEKQLDIFNNDPEVGLVFSDAYFFDDKGVGKQIYKNRQPPTGYVFGYLLSNYFLVMSTVMIKKEVMGKMNQYFDPNYEMIEEYEFFLRIANLWKLDYCNEILGMWRMHANNTTFTKGELIPSEKEHMLKKFDLLIPNFNHQYRNEIKIVKQKISLTKSLNFYLRDERSLARSEIWDLVFTNKKALVYFIGTFLPKKIFIDLYRFFTGSMPV